MYQWIELPSEPHDSLDWTFEIDVAKRAVEAGKQIIWKIAAGLEGPFYPLDDELRFEALSLALRQFSKDVWPQFQEKTCSVCLYRASADFHEFFSWTERQQSNFKAWLEEEGLTESLVSKRLFAAEAFAIYFQMLSHRIPDEAQVQLLFDLEAFDSASEALQVISKERFEHFQIAVRGMELPLEGFWWEEHEIRYRAIEASVAIVFPTNIQLPFMQSFDQLLKKRGGENVKILFEGFLSEDWEGLDRLLVIKGSLNHQGDRKLKGFCAAGGEIVYVD